MARRCEICGKGQTTGRTYTRRGLAKSKGGVGKKITGKTNRTFRPNLQKVKLLESNGTVRTRRICASCLRTGLKKGTAVKAVSGRRAGLVKPAEQAEQAEQADKKEAPVSEPGS